MSGATDLIIKIIQDKEAREILFKDPDRLLRDYKLTEKEVASIKGLDRRTFDKALAEMGADVERRISRGGIDIGGVKMHTLDYPVVENFDGG